MEPWSLWSLIGGTALAVALPLGLTWVTPLAGDLAMIAIATAAAGGGAWAIRIRRWLDRLPLEIAPVIATGRVDGARIYRLRARLGRGRCVREVTAALRVRLPDGSDLDLPTQAPQGTLCGPFTAIARAPEGQTPTRFHVEVAAIADGRRWTAEADLGPEALRDGRFGGIGTAGGHLQFDPAWTEVVSESAGA